jgi:hypothetical protein
MIPDLEIDRELVSVCRQRDVATERLRDALLAGTDSKAIRAELRGFGRRVDELQASIADAVAQQEAAAEEAISAAAATIAATTIDLITARLSALQAPPHP